MKKSLLIFLCVLPLLLTLMLTGCGDNDCGMCNGSGYYQKKTCPACHGSGYSSYDPYDSYKNLF